MSRWQFLIADTAGNVEGELIAATNRQLQFNLDAACTAGFSVAGLHPDATLPVEGETDLLAYRWSDTHAPANQLLFRGRIASGNDQLDATTDQVDFTAKDYRGMLANRHVWAGDPLVRVDDQAYIPWDLIAHSETMPGGFWGITYPVLTPTGVTRTLNLNVGAALDQTIDTFANVQGGFDWEIGPDLEYRTWYPARGRISGLQFDYPGLIMAFQRSTSIETFGNAVLSTGDNAIASVGTEVSSFGPSGRLEQVFSDPDIKDLATLTARGAYELAFSDQLPSTWQITLRQGTWDPVDLWLGDVVGLYINRGRLHVDQACRVTQIGITIDSNGVETVQVTLGPVLLQRGVNVVPDSTATEITASDSIIKAPTKKVPTLQQVLAAQSKGLQVVTRLSGSGGLV